MQDLQVIKILVVDSHEVVGCALARLLEDVADFHVVGHAKSGEEALRLCEHHFPDILLVDIDLAGPLSGMEVIRLLLEAAPQMRVMVLTNLLEGVLVHDALQEGIVSYLLTNVSPEEFVHAIRVTYVGKPTLSPEVTQLLIHEVTAVNGFRLTAREQQILELLTQGRNNQRIARDLNISLSTVQFHVSNILNKLNVDNRIEAAAYAVSHKLVLLPDL